MTKNTDLTSIKLVCNDSIVFGYLEVNSDLNLRDLGSIKQMVSIKIKNSDYEIK